MLPSLSRQRQRKGSCECVLNGERREYVHMCVSMYIYVCTCLHLSVWCRTENGLLSWFISLPWFLSSYLLVVPPFLPRLGLLLHIASAVYILVWPHCPAQSSSPGQRARPLPWLLCMVPADDPHSDSLYRELSSDRGRHLSLAVVMLTHEERDVRRVF